MNVAFLHEGRQYFHSRDVPRSRHIDVVEDVRLGFVDSRKRTATTSFMC